MLSFIIAAVKGAFARTVQLANESTTSTCPEGQTCDYILRFKIDGILAERVDQGVGGTSEISASSSPWSDDPSEDGTGVHCRIVSHDSGVDRYTDNLTVGTWYEITTQRDFIFQNSNTSGPYSGLSTYTFAISLDGGSTTHDTMTLSLTLTNEGP